MYPQSEYYVGKTSPPPNSSPNHGPNPQKNPQLSQCFTCKKTGHWYQNCPEKSSTVKNTGEATHPIIITTNKHFPVALRCRCGSGDCPIRTSNSDNNPNRNYYICAGTTPDKECGYFKWCDRVTADEFENPPQYRFPKCICGAGICYLEQVRGGPNDGRQRFVCRIPKGYGACSFSQLFDPQRDIVNNGEAESINLNTSPPILENQSNSDFSEDENVSSKLLNKRHFESFEIDNPQHSPSPDAISPSKRSNVQLSEGMKNYENAPISPQMPNDSLLCSFDANAGSANGPTKDLVVPKEKNCGSIIENTLKSILLTSEADFRFCTPQTEICSQVAFAEGVYPNLESVPLDIFPSTSKQGARISPDDFRCTNGSQQTKLMEVSISETIRLAALTIQNNLIKRLDSMDILDHEDMVRASESTFSVLDQLGFESTHFRARVLEFIECSSSQAAIAMLICDDLSSQKLVDEQELLEFLTCTHAEVMSELKNAKELLGSLKNKLLQIESQVSDCEAETDSLESRVAGISEKMAMSEKRLEAASMNASKIREQREVELSAAKAALEKAKLQLRQ